MECRRTVITSGVLHSPPSASAAPLTMAANIRARGLRNSRLYDCDDEVIDEYNNNNNSNVVATTINNTTQLVDELEQLRTDNFQLRLRVYNAERRVDKLSAAALRRDREKRCNSTNTDSDDTDDSSDHKTAAAKKTAEAAVRTIHDLLTVNRRLLALLAATVSAKAVSVSADDKRRWRRLRKHIEKYTTDDLKEEKSNELDDDDDDEFHDESASDSETSCKAQVVSYVERSATRKNTLRSPPPPTIPSSSAPLETTGEDDEGAGSEVSRLRGRCRRLERSLQQLVNTELWARNRQIGKLEQQRYVTQVADAAVQRDRKPAETVAADTAAPPQHYLQQFRSEVASTNTPLPVTKGILVKRLPAETPTATASTTATESLQNHRKSPPTTVTSITTPPPVLPDYSEVNFFFSCDEEEEDEDSAEMNTSSPEEDTADSNDCGGGDEEPVRLAAIGAPVSSTSARKRHCRPHHRQPQQSNCKNVGDTATVVLVTTTTSSSSTESASTADEADDLNGDGVIPIARSRTVSGGSGLHRRRRCRPPRRCSTCGRCSGVADAVVQATDHSKPPPLTDAQVQCGDGSVAVDPNCSSSDGVGEQQLQLLRRELDARRRENGRLYDILLRLQRGTRSGDRGKGDGGPRIPSPDLSDSDLSGSPDQRAAGAVHGRIADLLPPLLSMRSISDDDGDDDDGGAEGHRRDQPDGAEQQQQQQLMLLTRLRERIVAYERRELNGGDDRAAAGMAQPRPEDTSNDAIRRMDRADLLNVALPRVVKRLRQALVPLLQHRSENAVAAASGKSTNVGGGGGDSAIDGAPPSPPTEGR
ncbi:unnamed protein product [Aphis gossypii]|uniref:Uncharacterized protein n=1 Tax=Aphis gossypii TaxID=80765 RepID=A0A9P0NKZ0_APHGO|nr:unnamed protein product [Aphis gossypii]